MASNDLYSHPALYFHEVNKAESDATADEDGADSGEDGQRGAHEERSEREKQILDVKNRWEKG